MSLIKKLLTVEGITGMVISFIAYKAITLTLDMVTWLQTTIH